MTFRAEFRSSLRDSQSAFPFSPSDKSLGYSRAPDGRRNRQCALRFVYKDKLARRAGLRAQVPPGRRDLLDTSLARQAGPTGHKSRPAGETYRAQVPPGRRDLLADIPQPFIAARRGPSIFAGG